MADQENPPAPSDPEIRLPANHFGPGPEFQIWTSLVQQTEEHRLKLLSIIEGEAQKGGDMLGGVIGYGDFVSHTVEIVDRETGEVTPARRTLILAPDQPPVEFVSTGVLQSLRRIAAILRRTPPYDPPIQVKVTQQRTSGGGRTFKLVPVWSHE